MRLFYAITFDETVRHRLLEIQNALRARTVRGNYTLFENLHLTLVFIGETAPDRAAPLFEIAKNLRFEPFLLRICGLGCFTRGGGRLVWAGVEENERLSEIQARLSGFVAAAGFRLEKRPFTPHLTLAREVRFKEGFRLQEFSQGLKPVEAAVAKVSLMLSERQNGRLVYTELA